MSGENFDGLVRSRLGGENDPVFYSKYVEQKAKRWLVSADALAKGRESNSGMIATLESAERNDHLMLQTAIELMRESIHAVPVSTEDR